MVPWQFSSWSRDNSPNGSEAWNPEIPAWKLEILKFQSGSLRCSNSSPEAWDTQIPARKLFQSGSLRYSNSSPDAWDTKILVSMHEILKFQPGSLAFRKGIQSLYPWESMSTLFCYIAMYAPGADGGHVGPQSIHSRNAPPKSHMWNPICWFYISGYQNTWQHKLQHNITYQHPTEHSM